MPALWFCLLIVQFYLIIIAQIDTGVQGKCLMRRGIMRKPPFATA